MATSPDTTIKANSPWMIDIKAGDNALAPVITKGETIAIDCSERDLIDGGIYAIKINEEVALWLFHEGFAGMGALASGEDLGTLTSLAGSFRCSGPIAVDSLKVIGRLASDAGDSDIQKLATERSLLLAALDECRGAVRRHTGGLRELQSLEVAKPEDTLANWRKRYEDIIAGKETSKRFALEQRIDAINARLMFLEDQIADAKAVDVSDVTAKLQVLWDLHHAPFPATHNDLAARIVATSLRGLNKSGNPPTADTNEDQDGTSPAIKLVSSPRRR